jgi:hypothetical protein
LKGKAAHCHVMRRRETGKVDERRNNIMFRQTLSRIAVLIVAVMLVDLTTPGEARAQFYYYDDTPPQMGYIYPGVPYTNRWSAPYYQGYGPPYVSYYVRPFPPVWAPNYRSNYYGNYYGPTIGAHDAYYYGY